MSKTFLFLNIILLFESNDDEKEGDIETEIEYEKEIEKKEKIKNKSFLSREHA